jgi:hypothetical protein
MRTILILALALFASTPALADVFMQARCPQHRVEWRGPRRSSRVAFRDADAHNKAHHGHDARVVMFDHEQPHAAQQAAQASIEPSTKMQ